MKRLVYAPFNSVESLNTAYDHQNFDGAKVTSYQTYIDSQPLQDSVLSCKQPVVGGVIGMDDYRENRMHLRASAIENSVVYYENWCHVDSFSQPKRGKILLPSENIMEGLDLSAPRQWTITAACTAAMNHYIFGTFVRKIQTSPAGTQVITTPY